MFFGFICEASGLVGAGDISHFGGWAGLSCR
ncbi:hypothetical protein [Zhongshania sp.]